MAESKAFLKIVGALLLGAAGAQGASAALPTGWELLQQPRTCTLMRTLASADGGRLIFSAEPGNSYRIQLAMAALPRHPSYSFPVELRLTGAEKRIAAYAMPGKPADRAHEAIDISGVEPGDMAQLMSASAVRLRFGGGGVGPLPLDGAAEAIPALTQCVAQRMIDMGADAAQFAPGGAGPVALVNRDSWLSVGQMLAVARARSEAHGVDARFRVGIDPAGKIDDCAEFAGGSGPEVERLACDAVVGRTLFRPATDPQGRAVRSVAVFPVTLSVSQE